MIRRLDWISLLIYLLLVLVGYINIYSATSNGIDPGWIDLGEMYGKQFLFIVASLCAGILLLAIEAKVYERFSSIFYLISLLSLLGLFAFGKTINGATSWYAIGGMTLQPSEFAKTATALALAKFLSDIQTNIQDPRDLFKAFIIIGLPALFVLPQPDAGSALIFSSLVFVLYREGLTPLILIVALAAVILFALTLIYGSTWVILGLIPALALAYYIGNRKRKTLSLPMVFLIFILAGGFSYSVGFIYDNIFEQRHRDRFSLWLRLEDDPSKLEHIRKTIGYNTYQSESAIGSGGLFGKGFLEGTRTKGDFVPEQHTDYIFSTIGEEWGFAGTATVVLLFTLLILRILHVSERQKSGFSRMYGYGVASILFFHFAINVGMVIGLVPTIGIPLPFISYGGSSLLGFTALLFIFLKLDANRLNEW